MRAKLLIKKEDVNIKYDTLSYLNVVNEELLETKTQKKYKGLLISIRPALDQMYGVIKKAKAMGEEDKIDNVFPVRVLVALLKTWDEETEDWIFCKNDNSKAYKNRFSFYFEDIFPAIVNTDNSIYLNGEKYNNVEEMTRKVMKNNEERKASHNTQSHDCIEECTVIGEKSTTIKASKSKHSRLIVEGEGPLFLRYRQDNKPFCLRRGGELLWHLNKTTLTTINQI